MLKERDKTAIMWNPVAKQPKSRRKSVAHFGMVFMFVVPVYRSLLSGNIANYSSTPLSNENPWVDLGSTVESSAVNVTVPSSNNDELSANNLAKVRRISCGKEKCFFPLKSNRTVGYLVSRTEDREDRRERFETLEAGYELAQSLHEKLQMHHFLLAPPQRITVTSELEPPLNRNLWSEKSEKMWKRTKFPEGSMAFIQKVQVAPRQTILIGCSLSKVKPFERNVKTFMQQVKYTESFAQRFRENMLQVRRIFSTEPCLIKDFQCLLDTKGQVFHLDFDRCFAPDDATTQYVVSQNETDMCLEILGKVERAIEGNLGIVTNRAVSFR